MHLLVLSAFRPEHVHGRGLVRPGLNAPSGAQCFPTHITRRACRNSIVSQCTFWCSVLSDWKPFGKRRMPTECLNAPSGAQCFPTRRSRRAVPSTKVSMHLLVLSAFRLRPQKTAPQRRLPERNRRRPGKHHIESARTCPIKPHNREKPPQTTPAPPTPPTSQYATDFQPTQAKKPTPHNYARVNFVLLGV